MLKLIMHIDLLIMCKLQMAYYVNRNVDFWCYINHIGLLFPSIISDQLFPSDIYIVTMRAHRDIDLNLWN